MQSNIYGYQYKINNLTDSIKSKDNQIKELKATIKRKDAEISNLKGEIKRLNKKIDEELKAIKKEYGNKIDISIDKYFDR